MVANFDTPCTAASHLIYVVHFISALRNCTGSDPVPLITESTDMALLSTVSLSTLSLMTEGLLSSIMNGKCMTMQHLSAN